MVGLPFRMILCIGTRCKTTGCVEYNHAVRSSLTELRSFEAAQWEHNIAYNESGVVFGLNEYIAELSGSGWVIVCAVIHMRIGVLWRLHIT